MVLNNLLIKVMNKIVIILLLCTIAFTSCREEMNTTEINENLPEPEIFVESSLIGRVIDEDGNQVPNVSVSINDEITNSNTNGNFEFQNIIVKKRAAMVSVESPGYFKGIAQSDFQSENTSFTEVVLHKKTGSKTVDVAQGGMVNFGDELSFDIGANVFRNEDGILQSGIAELSSKYIDPSADSFAKEMPGELITKNDANEIEALIPYGMLVAEFNDTNGGELELENGVEANIKIPEDLVDQAPDEIALYLYDLEKERWYLAGTCKKTSSGTYSCSIASGGYYCCAVPQPSICIRGSVFNSDGSPASHIKVQLKNKDNRHVYFGYTNKDGFFCGSIPSNTELELCIIDHCDVVVYNETISAGDLNFSLNDIYLEDSVNEYLVRITGKVKGCDDLDLESGHLVVTYGSKRRFLKIVNGVVDEDIAFKCTEFPNLRIQAFSKTEQQRSIVFNANEFADEIIFETLTTCEDLDDFFIVESEGETYWLAPTKVGPGNETPEPWTRLEALGFQVNFILKIKDYVGEGAYSENIRFLVSDENIPACYPLLSTISPDFTLNILVDNNMYIEGNMSGTALNQFTGEDQLFSGTFKFKK